MITTTNRTLSEQLSNNIAVVVPFFKNSLLKPSSIDGSASKSIWENEIKRINNSYKSESLYTGRIIVKPIEIQHYKILLVGVVAGQKYHFIDNGLLKKYLLLAIHRCAEHHINTIYIPMSPRIGLTRRFIKEFLHYNILPENVNIFLYSKFQRRS